MEAFSDGVLAIIITIMILELTVPSGDGLKDLLGLGPTLVAYLISYLRNAEKNTGWESGVL